MALLLSARQMCKKFSDGSRFNFCLQISCDSTLLTVQKRQPVSPQCLRSQWNARAALSCAELHYREVSLEILACVQIMDKVLAGDIDGAMELTEALAPGTLEANPGLLFKMHLQTFLELVSQTVLADICMKVVQHDCSRTHFLTQGHLSEHCDICDA